jgi:predicted secreted protein
MAQERAETKREANVGKAFDISLESNPSTGYRWQLQKSASSGLHRITIQDRGISASKDGAKRMGAPGHAHLAHHPTPLGHGPPRARLRPPLGKEAAD